MKDCPFCNYPLEDIDKFCRSCGANLALPEFERAFCPHCGVRVLTSQWYCQQCKWPLEKGLEKEEEEPTFAAPPTAHKAASRLNRTWIIGGLLGAGLFILVIFAWLLGETPIVPPSESTMARLRGIPSGGSSPIPSNPLLSMPKATSAEPSVEESKEILRQHLSEVLNNLQKAQMKKDISLYMKSFSDSFPSMEDKRRKVLAIWKIYDYTVLQYDLEKITPLDTKNALAQVRWTLETRKRTNQVNEKFTQSYKVWFSWTDEGWRIKNLEELPRP